MMITLNNSIDYKPVDDFKLPYFDDDDLDLEASQDEYYLHLEDEYEDRYIYEELIRD